MGEKCQVKFCLNIEFHVTFRDLLHAVKPRHGTDGFTPPPKEGVLRVFFALKIRRLRPGANPRTWVPKANTLPPDHRSRFHHHNYLPLNMGQTESSETSAYKIQTPGNYPEENIQHKGNMFNLQQMDLGIFNMTSKGHLFRLVCK